MVQMRVDLKNKFNFRGGAMRTSSSVKIIYNNIYDFDMLFRARGYGGAVFPHTSIKIPQQHTFSLQHLNDSYK